MNGYIPAPAHSLAIAVEFHEPHMIFPALGIDNLVVGEWLVMAALILMALMLNRVVAKVPNSRIQGFFEMLILGLEDWLAGFIGSKKDARRYIPLLATFFMFILFSNYSGLVPTAGQHWSFFPPTGKWGTTIGLALVVMVAVQIIAIQEMGVKEWLAMIFETQYGFMAILMGPLRFLEEFVRPFSLSLRLFGNIFAEEVLLGVFISLVPLLVPLPIMGLSLLFGAIQAVVFTTLTAIYIGGVLEHKRHMEHAHAHAHGAAHAHGH